LNQSQLQPEYLLKVNQVTISIRKDATLFNAVENISYTLQKGTVLGIAGASGSGKSLGALAIMGLLPSPGVVVRQGEIWFNHASTPHPVNLLALSDKQMQQIRGNRIAMIFQEPMTSLNPTMRCGRQVAENILQHEKVSSAQAQQRTLELFTEVMLPEPKRMYNAYPHQLSGGQKQRVMIAMALACKPDILIADEPTTALDVSVQKTILQLLGSLKNKLGLSLIFITHNLDVLAEIANDVIIMQNGNIVEQGSVEKIFSHPEHAYTRALLACRPPIDTRPVKLPVIEDFINNTVPDTKVQLPAERKFAHTKIYDQPPVFQIHNLNVTFDIAKNIWGKPLKQFHAVKQVSFRIYKGETLGLVGESGSGKTTLGRALLRLIESGSGSILFHGVEIGSLAKQRIREIRKQVQIIFQDPYASLNPRLTAGEAIIEPMRVYNLHRNDAERRQRVEFLLQKVGLEPAHYNRYPHEFSGGQRQRIGIARALAVEPEFIICDESVSALDVSVQAQVLNLLNELKADFGLTYLFISHDLSVVRYMSDRIIVLRNGEIAETGEADHLYAHPVSDYTKQLLDSIPGYRNHPYSTTP
jgi:peptide/nickel transport system ATP-binding protein